MDLENLRMAFATYMSLIVTAFAAITILNIVTRVFIFKKAGQAWWKALIPIYSSIIYQKIATGKVWHYFVKVFTPLSVFFIPYTRLMLSQRFGLSVELQAISIVFPQIADCIIAFGAFNYGDSINHSTKSDLFEETSTFKSEDVVSEDGKKYMYDENGKAYYYDEEDDEYYYVD